MSIYFEKARELGKLMLESEQGLRLSDARAVFDNDRSVVEMLEEFKNYQENVNKSMRDGATTQDQYTKASQIMLEKTVELKKHPIVGELIKTENEFYAFVNQVLGVVKATITGDIQEQRGGCGSGGCSGSCGSCK